MRDTGLSDSEILIGVIAGDQKAYRQLFLRYYTIIYRFLLKMLSDADLAEDLSQDIFMSVWVRRATLDPEGSIKNYLYVLAKNKAINQIRKKRFVQIDSEIYQISSDLETDGLSEYDELLANLEKTISSMPSQRQAAFRLSRQEHLSNKEIADIMKISVRTVEKHIELALKDLRSKNISAIAFLLYVISLSQLF